VLYGVAGTVDVIQIVIDFTGVGIAASEVLEVAMPFIIGGILFIFRLLNVQTGISVVIAVVLDAATGGFAPFWVGDVYYIQRQIRSSEAAQQTEQEDARMSYDPDMPSNYNNRREPDAKRDPNLRPMVVDGRKEPRA